VRDAIVPRSSSSSSFRNVTEHNINYEYVIVNIHAQKNIMK
jgi:hypothetical protein